MRALKSIVGYLLPGVLVVFYLSAAAAPCAGQEVETPTPRGTQSGGRSVVAPSPWVVLTTPVTRQVGIKLYGFYVGDVKVPAAQVDVPIRAAKFLTITPSYLYNWIPPSGLNKVSAQPREFSDSYEEQQFRIDGTLTFPIHKFEISARNMYVRRFRPAPIDDINRYRGRISIAHPLSVQGRIWKPFASYESFYERNGGWNRDRVWTGVTLPLAKQVSFQPSYMWESSQGNRDIHYLLFGVFISTK